MSVVRFQSISKAFGAVDLFSGLSANVPRGARIGLVGPNGIGKTTLLRILIGQLLPTAGSVFVSKGTRIGYLEQEAADGFTGLEQTVFEEMLNVFAELRTREVALRRMEAEMAESDASDALLARYGTAQEAFARDGGYDYELQIQQVLSGLGFLDEQQHMPVAHCSGGQKTRALLARLLLEKPDLLVLDEPTNHLDIDAVAWLESALQRWEGALIVVSHDRYFLDQIVNVVWEMSRRGIETYRGNYSAYLTQREERWAWRIKEFRTVQERFLKNLDFIKRNIVRASTTARAKGLLKRLTREVQAVQLGGTEALNQKWSEFMRSNPQMAKTNWNVSQVESAIKGLSAPNPGAARFKLRLRTGQRGGNLVLRANEVEIGYPETSLFHIDELVLRRGECAALIGSNGTGKSTFLKTLLDQMPTLSGKLRLGANLEIRHFAQAYAILDPEQTVIAELLTHQHMGLGAARDLLARYLFRGDDVFKQMKALSGGERGRFALAVLALHPVNLLLLDEPTNHLDILGQEILEDALKAFPGTILMVSHDRYLVDRLATQVWELREGQLHITRGNYTDYVAARQRERLAATEVRKESKETVPQHRAQRQAQRAEMNHRAELECLLAEIDEQEAKVTDLAQALVAATEIGEWGQIRDLNTEYRESEAELTGLIRRWEEMEVQATR
ncbi:MAG: ABC-F family ATP-binding cassette domain-containing protein [Anaerolineae bacterium]|nr:ABC-F family ATP-binding cassette domain-containing protein [Anaerolineae bacterium]